MTTAPGPAAARRVLVVEDEDAVRAVTRKVLERAGYVVEEAPNGRRALEALEAMPALPDVVVSDLVMPELNGAALARTLRERWPDLPVILLSGFADAAREGEMAGTTLLAKPLDPQTLVAAVAGAVRR